LTVNDTSGGSGFSGLATRKLTGRIKIHPAGYGFVVPDDKSEDVHVSARNRGAAMDADTVEIEAWPAVRGIEGRVLRVLARGRAKITGQLMRRGKEQVLQPDDPRIAGPVTLRGPIPSNAPDGIAVVAEITRYPDVPDGPIEAAVLKVLGDPDDPRTEVEKVLACASVEEAFPDDIARIADGIPTEVRDADRVDRTDLRAVPFTTEVDEFVRNYDQIFVVEMNRDGQLHQLLSLAYPDQVSKLKSVAFGDGMPASAKWMREGILAQYVQTAKKKTAKSGKKGAK
jgi:ribonuclease R